MTLLKNIIDSFTWQLLLIAATLYTVFGIPLYMLSLPGKLNDLPYIVIISVVFIIFVLDCISRVVVYRWVYIKTLGFWLDFLSIVFLILGTPGLLYYFFSYTNDNLLINPRVFRLTRLIIRLTPVGRLPRFINKEEEFNHQSETGIYEQQASTLQMQINERFSTLVIIFVILAILIVPVTNIILITNPYQKILNNLTKIDKNEKLLHHYLEVIKFDKSILQVKRTGKGDATILLDNNNPQIQAYERLFYTNNNFRLIVSNRAIQAKYAISDCIMALFIIMITIVFNLRLSVVTKRILIDPLHKLKSLINNAIRQNKELTFLENIRDTEPIVFLEKVFIPLLQRVIAAVNTESKESILELDESKQNIIKKRDWAILFSDVEGYVTITETFQSESFKIMNKYFEHCSKVVFKYKGDIFETTGDGLIITFDGEEKEKRAFLAAIEIIETLDRDIKNHKWNNIIDHPEWTEEWTKRIRTRLGIHVGSVSTGRIGTDKIFRYGMVGETAGLSARLESANKHYGTYLLFSDKIFTFVPADYIEFVRQVDYANVVGKNKPIAIYTYDFNRSANYHDFRKDYNSGIYDYLAGKWDVACKHLTKAHNLWPDERATLNLLERMNENNSICPPDWDGSVQLKKK